MGCDAAPRRLSASAGNEPTSPQRVVAFADPAPLPSRPAPAALHVLRLCSVFEPPAGALDGRGASFDPVGGMQTHTACLTRALDERGVVQDVVTTRPPGAPRAERVGGAATVHRLGLPVPWLRQLYGLPALAVVDRLATGADLLHAHLGEDLAVVPIAAAAARRRRIPWVLSIHMSLEHTYAAHSHRTRAFRKIGAVLERHGARRADAVICLTPRLAALLIDAGIPADRVRVIPSGAVPAAFRSPRGEPLASIPRPRVVFVGRLVRQKGVQMLLEAMARLRTEGARLAIVGDGPQRASLERAASELGIGNRVRFLGLHAHDRIPAVLAGADVLALPSVYEELGSVLVEAMQDGLPIVATDVGGIPDAVGRAGVLVPAGDAVRFASALDALLADADRRARLGALARERARGFNWDVLADRVLGAYRVALARRRPRGGLARPANRRTAMAPVASPLAPKG